MNYDSTDMLFSVDSDDPKYEGKYQYTLEAHLTDYPQNATREKAVRSIIEFFVC